MSNHEPSRAPGRSRTESVTRASLLGGAAFGTGLVAGSLATAMVFARLVLTPDHRRADDTTVLGVADGAVTLRTSVDAVVPGRYGLWLDGGAGHARVGTILHRDDERHEVVRAVVCVDRGTLAPGPARWNPYYYWDSPDASMGLPTRHVVVETDLGPMPAWLLEPGSPPPTPPTPPISPTPPTPPISPTPPTPHGRWAVLVHGRGAPREECLRALPTLSRLGYTCLVTSYRNDVGAPPAPDGRYNLGLSEWRDVESAMQYAVERGAQGIVLVGWSMGGAIALQTLSQSRLSDQVEAVVLDSPVVDWGDVLAHHARLHHVPPPLRDLGTALMGRRATRRLVGVHDPVDVARTNWVARADELRHRILIHHSVDDEFVPFGPSRALAAARPDLVTWERWDTARHCTEWNLDPDRWERVLEDFLKG